MQRSHEWENFNWGYHMIKHQTPEQALEILKAHNGETSIIQSTSRIDLHYRIDLQSSL